MLRHHLAMVLLVAGCVQCSPPKHDAPERAAVSSGEQAQRPIHDVEKLVAELSKLALEVANDCQVTSSSDRVDLPPDTIKNCKDDSLLRRWRRTELRVGMAVTYLAYCRLLGDANGEVVAVAAVQLKLLGQVPQTIEAGADEATFECLARAFDSAKEPWVQSALARAISVMAARLNRADDILKRADGGPEMRWVRAQMVEQVVASSPFERAAAIYRDLSQRADELQVAAARGLTSSAENSAQIARLCAMSKTELDDSAVEGAVLQWIGRNCESGREEVLERVRKRLASNAQQIANEHVWALRNLRDYQSTEQYRAAAADALEEIVSNREALDQSRALALDALADADRARAKRLAARYVAHDGSALQRSATRLIPPPAEALPP